MTNDSPIAALTLGTRVTAFKTGTAKHVLVESYGIYSKSVKKSLRERGVKRRSRWDKAA